MLKPAKEDLNKSMAFGSRSALCLIRGTKDEQKEEIHLDLIKKNRLKFL